MLDSWGRYLAQDRRRALERGDVLPERVSGTALFADIDGFTPLTEHLLGNLGARLGAEEVARRVDAAYEVLIGACESQGGSVVGFAGDALTCWFDAVSNSAARALQCARAMKRGVRACEGITLKIGIGGGAARRFVVGDPHIQLLDALGGQATARMATAAQLAAAGDIIVDPMAEPAELEPLAVHGQRVAREPDTAPQSDDRLAQRLRPWLLPQVYEAERGEHGVFLTELRPTVALFLRFDGIDCDHDPQARERLDAVARCAQSVAQRHEGTLLQLTLGDKGSYAYLCFGAPVMHEDDAARAVRTAWQLREALRLLGFLTDVRMGIASGVSRTGAYGSHSRATYGALGDGVNLAARLMGAARDGQILLAPSVQIAASREFSLDAPAMLALKGRREAVEVRALGTPLPRRSVRLPQAWAGLPLIGRRDELARLEGALDAALQGRAQRVGIVGEAGIGKSRLVAEFIARAHARGYASLGGACSASGTTTPYLVWKPICRTLFGLDAQPAEPRASMEHRLRELAAHRVPALPVLAPVLDEPIDDNDFTRRLTPEGRRNLLAATLEDVLKAAAARRPLLVVFEDRHWIDALSAHLLQTLGGLQMEVPLCFVASSREAVPSADLQVALGSLTQEEARELVTRTLGWPAERHAEAAALADALNARAEGNPFYLEELLGFVRERGLLESDPATLTPELPGSLHALILTRIDRLSEAQRAMLKTASVIGRVFRADWLRGCYPSLGAAEELRDDLEVLRALDFTRLSTPEPQLSYHFKHVVIRDVAYESVPRATRSQLHEQLAGFIEASPEDFDLDVLAHHYGQSDRVDKQREYFRRAGDAARTAYANEAALAYYERLVPLLDEPRARFDVQVRRANVLVNLARHEDAVAIARDALALAEAKAQLDERCIAEAAQQLADALVPRGEFDEAHALLERAAETWKSLGEESRRSEVLVRQATAYRSRALPAQAVTAAQAAVTAAWASGNQLARARALAVLGESRFYLGDPAEARRPLEEALSLARAAGDPHQLALVLHYLAIVESHQGFFDQAKSLYEEGLEKATQVGMRHIANAMNTNYGALLFHHGHHADAQDRLERAVNAFRSAGNRAHLAGALCNLGLNEMALGDYEAAKRHLEESRALCHALGNVGTEGQAITALAELLMAQGRHAQARPLLLQSLQMRTHADDRTGLVFSLITLAQVLSSTGSARDAVRFVAAARQAAVQMGVWVDEESVELVRRQARAALHGDALQSAWEEGERLPLAQAVTQALQDVQHVD